MTRIPMLAATAAAASAVVNSIARRTATGTLVAADATQAGELVTFGQIGVFGRDRGAGSTLPTTDLRRGDVYAYTAAGGTTANLATYDGARWRFLGNKVLVANAAERTLLGGTYAGLRAEHADDGLIFRYDGTTWVPTTEGAMIRSKMWRTAGSSAAMTVNTENVAVMGASRLAGGFTFDAATNSLIVPFDGTYDVNGSYYVLGSAAGQINGWLRRVRSGVADATVANPPIAYKADTGKDQTMVWQINSVPLKAGDKLSLVIYPYVAGLSYFGATEAQGCYVTLSYVGPLNGATPV